MYLGNSCWPKHLPSSCFWKTKQNWSIPGDVWLIQRNKSLMEGGDGFQALWEIFLNMGIMSILSFACLASKVRTRVRWMGSLGHNIWGGVHSQSRPPWTRKWGPLVIHWLPLVLALQNPFLFMLITSLFSFETHPCTISVPVVQVEVTALGGLGGVSFRNRRMT